MSTPYTLSVPDMSCGHCKASVEAALTPLAGMAPITVDLAQRQVSVAGPAAEAGDDEDQSGPLGEFADGGQVGLGAESADVGIATSAQAVAYGQPQGDLAVDR